MTFIDWYDQNREQLEENFLDDHLDEWSCEEQGIELLESYKFQEYCEDKYNGKNENKNNQL